MTPWTVAHQDLLSKGFSRQEDWNGLPFTPPGESSLPTDLTQVSCVAGILFIIWATRQAQISTKKKKKKKGHDHCLVACCWSDPLHFPNPDKIITSENYAGQINEMHRKLLCLQLVLVNGQLTGQGPHSSPQHRTVSCTTKSWRNWARKFLATHIHSFTIFTWPLANRLPLLQAF